MRAGVTAVLDLTAEFSAPRCFRALTYRNMPVLDLTAPSLDRLGGMVEFITKEAQRGVVYVHCKIGYSRSAAAVGAYLLESGKAESVVDAMAQLRLVRPSIVLRPEVERTLRQFQTQKGRIWCSRQLIEGVSNTATSP